MQKNHVAFANKKNLYKKRTPISLRDIILLSVEHYVKVIRIIDKKIVVCPNLLKYQVNTLLY